MTSKKEADWVQTMASTKREPRTQLEEILFVVESTNDIASKILEMLEAEQERKLAYINWKRGPQSDSL